MSTVTDGKTVMPGQGNARPAADQADPADRQAGAVERALAAAAENDNRLGDLLDVLRSARLWLPLAADSGPVVRDGAVTLPTVCYRGSEFVPAYSSAELLSRLAGPGNPAQPAATVPHAVVRAADLASLLPASIGIALNAGASPSVPVYPEGVAYLAAATAGPDSRISLQPAPASAASLLAAVGTGLRAIPQVAQSAAAWLSVRFAGAGLIISATLDDPADPSVQGAVIAAVERAAAAVPPRDCAFPIDVTFPGEGEPDYIDDWISASATPFHRR